MYVSVSFAGTVVIAVVLASAGYPGAYETGKPIEGLNDLDPDVRVFHAGTRRDEHGALVTAGGRVLTIVATGASIEVAREKAYRRDIGATATAAAGVKE